MAVAVTQARTTLKGYERGFDDGPALWHPWLRINRVLRVMLHTRWSAEAWAQIRPEVVKRRSRHG